MNRMLTDPCPGKMPQFWGGGISKSRSNNLPEAVDWTSPTRCLQKSWTTTPVISCHSFSPLLLGFSMHSSTSTLHYRLAHISKQDGFARNKECSFLPDLGLTGGGKRGFHSDISLRLRLCSLHWLASFKKKILTTQNTAAASLVTRPKWWPFAQM